MQGQDKTLNKLHELAVYAQEKYESGNIVTIEVIPLGFSVRVAYRPNGQLFQLLRVISSLEFEILDTDILKEKIDRMVREVHLKYIQIANQELLKHGDTGSH